MLLQRSFTQWVGAAPNVGEVVRRTKIEGAQANNVNGAISGVQCPELSRRDPLLEQPLDQGIERRHSRLANLGAAALNAL